MSKVNKKVEILKLLGEGTSVKDVAKAMKVKPAYVYYVRWQDATKGKKAKKTKTVEQMRKDVAGIVDLVNSPPHYTQGGIETIDFIESKQLNYRLGNAVKYISRAAHKGNTLQDLEKAEWYLNREINAIRSGLKQR